MDNIRGRNLWDQLTHATILVEQVRQKDDTFFQQMLERIKIGEATKSDIEELKKKVITTEEIQSWSNQSDEWLFAPIIVSRNNLGNELNIRDARIRSRKYGSPLLQIHALDKFESDEVSNSLKKFILNIPDSKCDNAPGKLLLVERQPIILLKNYSTELGLTNGTTGIVRKILLHKNEYIDFSKSRDGVIELNNLPECIIIQVTNDKINIDKLGPGMIPIFPVDVSFTYIEQIKNENGDNFKVRIKRKGFPLAPCLVLTN